MSAIDFNALLKQARQQQKNRTSTNGSSAAAATNVTPITSGAALKTNPNNLIVAAIASKRQSTKSDSLSNNINNHNNNAQNKADFHASIKNNLSQYRISMSCSSIGIDGDDASSSLARRSPPANMYYIDEFITEEEERELIRQIYDPSNNKKWVRLTQRRLQNWGGIPHPDGMIREEMPTWLTAIAKSLVECGFYPERVVPNQVLLNEYSQGKGIKAHKDGPLYYPCASIISLGSSAVIDFYKDVSDNNNSSRSSGAMNKLDECLDRFSLLLRPRSLVVFSLDAYNHYKHEISDNTHDVIHDRVLNAKQLNVDISSVIPRAQTRLSLTLRYAKRKKSVVGGAGEDLEGEQQQEQYHGDDDDDDLPFLLTDEQRAEIHRRQVWWYNSISEKGSE